MILECIIVGGVALIVGFLLGMGFSVLLIKYFQSIHKTQTK